MNSLISISTAGQAPDSAYGDTGTLGQSYNLANGGVGYTEHNLASAQTKVSLGMWYKTGGGFAANQEGPHFLTLFNFGFGNMMRLSDERDGGTNQRQIRVSPSVQAVAVADNTWYWIAWSWQQNSTGTLNVYDTSFNLVGTTTYTDSTNVTVQGILMGNTSGTTGIAGQTTYFDNLLVNYTTAPFPLLPLPPVVITANTPTYNFPVLPSSTRQINVQMTGGVANTINWTVLSTTGGATATFTDPSHSGSSSISGALPTVQVNIGTTAGSCSISGSIGSYTVSSTATVTVQAQSVDNPTKTATFLFNVCANTTTVDIAPAYQQAFKAQHMMLQSWVTGNVDETGTWSILTQPVGGDGTLADTTKRDADFTATVTGRYVLKYTSAADNTKSATAIVYISPNALPIYAATPNNTQPRECYVDPALTGGDYEVGAGKAFTTIQSTPAANTLAAGSIMRIFNTDVTGTSPSTFHEYYQIASLNGTATQPMIVCGVPDSLGNLPILDGANATGQSGTSTGAAYTFGVLSLWAGGYGRSTPFGYWQSGSAGPSYVSITGLHIRNGTPNFTATPPAGGTPQPYIVGASCVNIRSGSFIDVAGVEMDTCTNGFFTAENTNSAWAPVTQFVTIQNGYIHGSGWSTDDTEHQAYFQSFFGVLQGMRISGYLNTALGSNVKWRGVEGIFRYNFIGTGPARDFDLVDNQDAAPYVSLEAYLSTVGQSNCNASLFCQGDTAGANVIAAYQESAQKDFVYGNMIQGASSEYQVHYAEDHDNGMADRNGTLYFYNNTFDKAQVVFDTGSGGNAYNPFYQQRVNAQNDIFWNTQLALNRYEPIVYTAQTNLANTGTMSIATPITGGNYNSGTANGWQSGCDGTCPWPLTSPINPHTYGLSSANYLLTSTQPYNSSTFIPPNTSAASGAGSALTSLSAQLPVRYQWNTATNSLTARTQPLTTGAVDAAAPPTPVSIALTPSPVLLNVGGTQTMVCTTTLSDSTTRNCIIPSLSSTNTASATVSGLVVTATSTPGTGNINGTAETLTAPSVPFTVTLPPSGAKLSGSTTLSGSAKIQ